MEGERIVLVKWSPLMAACLLAVTASCWVIPLVSVLRGSDPGALDLGLVALAAIPFLWVAWRAAKVVRGMGVTIDAAGIHPFDGAAVDSIGWHEIAGVGFGSYAGSHRGLKTTTIAGLEIYLADAAAAQHHPRLRNDWQEVASPQPGFSAGCFRYTISPYGPAGERAEQAVRRVRPQAWAGPFLHER